VPVVREGTVLVSMTRKLVCPMRSRHLELSGAFETPDPVSGTLAHREGRPSYAEHHDGREQPVRDVPHGLGISDVALAKICRKLDVPRPPCGYWQQLEHGQKPRRARLPKARPGTRIEFVIERREPRPSAPLDPALDKRKPDENGMLYLPAAHEFCFRISSALRRRTILILDAVARALEARGHSIAFESPEPDAWGPHAIRATVRGETVAIRFFEPLLRTDTVLTPSQQAQQKKHGWFFGPKHVFTPTGRLHLHADGGYRCRQKWADGNGRTVEQQLGAAALGFERVAVRVQESNAEWARRQEEWRAEARRKQISKPSAITHALCPSTSRRQSRSGSPHATCARSSTTLAVAMALLISDQQKHVVRKAYVEAEGASGRRLSRGGAEAEPRITPA
jgi:hypothetical protein